jgi:mannose-6-phosphate isomerase-like protein (cupin superfamily)
MTDLSGLLRGAEGDGVHWILEPPGELNVSLVHLDAGHAIGEHVNDAVDVVMVVLAGEGRLAIGGRSSVLTPHVVAHVPRGSRRSVRAADLQGLDYLSIHRSRGPLAISRRRPAGLAETGAAADEGGDPACWAHLFEDTNGEQPG